MAENQQPETNPLHPAMQKKLINKPRDVVDVASALASHPNAGDVQSVIRGVGERESAVV